jgi:glycosyltransferase involved in cell wall biosynthesis
MSEIATKTVCLLAGNDACYNPRLLKLGNSFVDRGAKVIIKDIRWGMGTNQVYKDVLQAFGVVSDSIDLRKDENVFGILRWLRVQAEHRLHSLLRSFRSEQLIHDFQSNLKGYGLLLKSAAKTVADVYVCNSPALLGIAAQVAKKNNAILWYDSQEYFQGMSSQSGQVDFSTRWERHYASSINVATASSRLIAERLQDALELPICLPLRNAAQVVDIPFVCSQSNKPLRLVWHGFSVNLDGRGLRNVLAATALMEEDFSLTLQGNCSDRDRQAIMLFAKQLGVESNIYFRPAVSPQNIVSSIAEYDVGLAVEPGVDDNQMMTSSNKIFEYLMAGLAVVASTMPGLIEVCREANTGVTVEPEDAKGLAKTLDSLSRERTKLNDLRRHGYDAARKTLNWETEVAEPLEYLESLLIDLALPQGEV